MDRLTSMLTSIEAAGATAFDREMRLAHEAIHTITGGMEVKEWQAKKHREATEYLVQISGAVQRFLAENPPRRSWLRQLGDLLRDHLFLGVVIELVIGLVALGLLAKSCDASPLVPAEASRFKREYTRIVRSEWGLAAPVASLAAQIQQESGWNCRAVSRVGARGCAQFMPATAKWIGDVDRSLREGDVFSPAWAFRAQAVYMKWLYDRVRYADNACERMAFGFAGYNGGEKHVRDRQKLSPTPGRCLGATCDINPGIAAESQRENADYPRRILRQYEPRYVKAGWGRGSCED